MSSIIFGSMPLRIRIMPDKFKGTLTALAAADAIAQGWRSARSQDHLELLPISDGGDGFGELIGRALGAESRRTPTVNAAHEPLEATWWWHPATRTAIVESARIIGLSLLPAGQYHPFALDTFGLGPVIRAVHQLEARRCLIGIGGSATNDGGFGLARSLGWQFRNPNDEPILKWTDLGTLARIQAPVPAPEDEAAIQPHGHEPVEFIVAVDVQNPLLGPEGCSRIYGPQKGLKPDDFALAEACLGQLARVVALHHQKDGARQPGAGAAGGLGFGLQAFLGASLEPGFALFAQVTRLNDFLAGADLVVTGEGAIDASTLMGKGVGELAKICRNHQIPCLGLAGIATDRDRLRGVFTRLLALTPDLTSPENAKTQASLWLSRAAAQAAQTWPFPATTPPCTSAPK